MARYALILVVLLAVACGPSLAQRPHGPRCEPRISALLDANPSDLAFHYAAALAVIENEFGMERPAMCDVTIFAWPHHSEASLQSVCYSTSAAACVNVDPDDGVYVVRYQYAQAYHLRHEFVHVLLSELDVPEPQHHRLMNRADVYYFPRGQNLHDN